MTRDADDADLVRCYDVKGATDLHKNALMDMIPMAGWRELESGQVKVWGASHGQALSGLMDLVCNSSPPSQEETGELLRAMDGHFAFVADGPGFLLAAVDKNRSIPVFYYRTPSGLVLGNCARALMARSDAVELDRDALLEVRMAGYATGRKTALRGLSQLLPGEFLLCMDESAVTRLERYYRYLPVPATSVDEDSLLEDLAGVTDAVFQWTAEAAGGRPIWVPLSGGLDSRLVLCKLHELGYANLHAYSYGMPGNHEARVAKTVAHKLGVSWEFVPVEARTCRRFFWSSRRRDYWRIGDGLSSIPPLQDVAVLKGRAARGEVPHDAVIINGQSGDYITGGHLPESLLSPNLGDSEIVAAIVSKHFSLWSDLKSPEALAYVDGSVRDYLAESQRLEKRSLEPAALYEAWEWQERQCKYVVNGVRMYDYVGMDWLMPLWHGRYMRFWEKVPFRLKLGQRLYKAYLARWDYAGLFRNYAPKVWRWPGVSIAVLPVAWILGRLAGAGAREWLYRRARYFGHYGFAYGLHGLGHFLGRADEARNPVSFMADTWADELEAEVAGGRDRA